MKSTILTTLPLLVPIAIAQTIDPSISSDCPPNQLWSYTLKTDDYPWETSFRLLLVDSTDANTNQVILSSDASGSYNRRSTYTDSLCLESGSYELHLNDAMGDGFCCNYGRGKWIMKLGDVVVGRVVGQAQFRNLEMGFVVGGDSVGGGGGVEWQPAGTETATTVAAAETTTATSTEAVTTTSTITTTELVTSTFSDDDITDFFFCGTDWLDASTRCYMRCVSGFHSDCPPGEFCFAEADCQNGVITAPPTTPAATTEMVSITTVSDNTESTQSAVDATESSSFNNNTAPTTSPTTLTEAWENYNPKHSKFCGPKVVGGYATAISQCGPLTMCGLTTTNDHYGSNGNDCPKGLMCYSDITCENKAPDNIPFNSRLSSNINDEDSYNDNVEGRTSGNVKAMDVSLKQDNEMSRLGDEEMPLDAAASNREDGSSANGRLAGGSLFLVGLTIVLWL